MSRYLTPIRLVRPAVQLRIITMRPPTLARTYATGSEMNDDDPKKIEEAKKRSLEGEDKPSETIDHAPGWNETLASVSEAHIKADKEDLSNVTIEELQTKTIKHVKAKHH